jgi:hypothetical protein
MVMVQTVPNRVVCQKIFINATLILYSVILVAQIHIANQTKIAQEAIVKLLDLVPGRVIHQLVNKSTSAKMHVDYP